MWWEGAEYLFNVMIVSAVILGVVIGAFLVWVF